MSASTKTIVAMLVTAVLAVGFWMLLLGPKREEASELGKTVSGLKQTVANDRVELRQAQAARKGFPHDYQQLVVLGKAAPSDDETASLLVSLTHISTKAKVSFREIALEGEGGASAEPAVAAAPPTATTPSSSGPAAPTEAAAATLPLGATIGPAGFDVMPYHLKFIGLFPNVADFIGGLDSLVKTKNSRVAVDGRLITVDGFSLTSTQAQPFPYVEANFAVTTFLVPPGQGVSAGATPEAPAAATGTPVSSSTGGTP